MRRLNLILPLLTLSLVSCTSDGSDDSGDEVTDLCVTPISVASTLPEDGATGVFVGDTIEVTFSDADSSATLTVTAADGTVAPGTLSWRDATLIYTPTGQLIPETDYTVAVNFSCGEPSVGFTTSATGQPLTADLLDRTYDMSLTGARILQPTGVQDLVESFLGTDVLAGVQSTSPSLQLLGAVATEDSDPLVQSECTPTVPFPAGNFTESPNFVMGPADETFAIGEASLTMYDLKITGTFTADGTAVHGITLSGLADTRAVGKILSENASEQTACNLASAAGVVCEPCPDGENLCITIVADRISASEVAGLTLTIVDDPCDNAQCSEEPECADDEA